MLGWLRALMPREDRYYDLFEAHANIAVEAALCFRRLLDGGPDVPALCDRITAFELQADDVSREVMLALRRSFITPFDRGDIHGLINDLDDAVDQMRQTVKAISIYDVGTFTPDMARIGDVIVKSASIVQETLPLLRQMNANSAKINAANERIIKLEEQADALYLAGLKELFQASRDNGAMAYIVGAEIYSHLEGVVDCFEDVANRMSGILLEHL
jgi:uncharacterized protein Yka (UPF0111/DUF47 family)